MTVCQRNYSQKRAVSHKKPVACGLLTSAHPVPEPRGSSEVERHFLLPLPTLGLWSCHATTRPHRVPWLEKPARVWYCHCHLPGPGLFLSATSLPVQGCPVLSRSPLTCKLSRCSLQSSPPPQDAHLGQYWDSSRIPMTSCPPAPAAQ